MTKKADRDAIREHHEVVHKLRDQLKLYDGEKPPTAAMQRKEREQLLSELKQRLEAATAGREKVMARYDEEIQRREEQVRLLEEELRSEEPPKRKRTRAKAKD